MLPSALLSQLVCYKPSEKHLARLAQPAAWASSACLQVADDMLHSCELASLCCDLACMDEMSVEAENSEGNIQVHAQTILQAND